MMTFSRTILSCAILTILNISAYANHETDSTYNTNNNKVYVALNTIHLTAQNNNEIGKTIYTKEDLERTPNSQKTISEFLKVNANIEFSNNANAAASQGEINSGDMSIHGALPYNNSFLVNGMNINNDINPYSNNTAANHVNNLAGSSQAITINTDLLCNLEVLDSNVSAKYGKFTGGVISAETCAPKTEVEKIHGSINYDYTNSSWNRFNYIDADEEADFLDPAETSAQKNYSKQGFSLFSYGRLSNTIGMNLGFTQRKSDIDANSLLIDARPYNETRQADNTTFELFYDPSDDFSAKLGLQHFEDKSLRFVATALTDGIKQSSNSDSINLNLKNNLGFATLKQNISYQEKKNNRESSINDIYAWYYSEDKNWGSTTQSTEGTFGNIYTKQKTFNYDVSGAFEDIQLFQTRHHFNIGAGFEHTNAGWYRPEDYSSYFLPTKFGTDCIQNDGTFADACDASFIPSKNTSGQYSTRKTVYLAGNIDLTQDSWYAFAEDKINWNDTIEATIGLRYDYDSITKNGNIAPRTSLNYMPFSNQSLILTTGWNRYYDRYLYTFSLQDGLNNLQQRYDRKDLDSPWTEGANNSSINVSRNQLDLPYANEWLIGMSGEFSNWSYQLKYIKRDYKDQYYLVRPDPTDLWTRIYTNDKTYRSKNITFNLNNITPIDLFEAEHRFNLALNYSNTKRDYNNADEVELKNYTHVLFNGSITTPNDIPASDFNTPITARLSWDFTPHRLTGLNISNFLIYKPHYDDLTKSSIPAKDQITHNGLPIIYSYNDTKIPTVFRWDMRISYTQKLSKNINGIFGLTINNVTNRHNVYLDNDYYLKSEIGRQFIADITLKF
ncbi:TonB-dependent receptor plug domain-containing protein [Acinetobacter equi]|nr:TonB-dependent receptor plug domain-containing protein [Acinetobacter equi]